MEGRDLLLVVMEVPKGIRDELGILWKGKVVAVNRVIFDCEQWEGITHVQKPRATDKVPKKNGRKSASKDSLA